MKRVIAFEDFPVPHMGGALARMLRKMFVNFNLKDKIMSITLDNASNNTSATGKLKLKYEPPMNGRFYHSRYVAHIINLVVQDGLVMPAINAIKESFKTMLKDIFKSGGRNYKRYIKICAEEGKHCLSPNCGASSLRASGGNQMSRLLYRLKEHTNKKARNDPSLSSEYERYVHSDFVTHLENNEFAAFDLLVFRKAKESIFPVLSRMAMDIISVQATSVASESAFSTSERVLSIQRTRLTLVSLEMCMCLKDHLDAQECKQDKSSLENPVDFEEEILDAEVQQNKAIPLSEEEIALDVASSEGTMSGSGSGGEEVDYDMMNYGDDYE
ncbi:zinc finger BED domain-containing protein RICESLEEPER 2 [Tanacetum coccineum]